MPLPPVHKKHRTFFAEEAKSMESIKDKKPLELELQIEELEDRIAPDGGETVLPVGKLPRHPKHP